MGAYIMNFPAGKASLIKEVQEEFNKIYPFLKIEFAGKPARQEKDMDGMKIDNIPHSGKDLLEKDVLLSDEMEVGEFEKKLQSLLGIGAQVLRRSGNIWIETRMTQHWTLKEQNEHGEDITKGF